MCGMPMRASFLIRVSGLSFMSGMIGSIRTDVGIPCLMRVSAVFSRSDGGGELGSMRCAILSSSVVIVSETMEGVFLSKSMSLITSVDFVIIWIRQSALESVCRHFLVRQVVVSWFG